MSSNNYSSQSTLAKENPIIKEILSFIAAGRVIVPFREKCLPGDWSPGHRKTAFIDLVNYQSIEEYYPLNQTITVECGIKINKLEKFLAEKQQWLPVTYDNEETSLLDLILTGNAGPREMVFGGLGRHILGLTFILSNGQLAKSGGRVVKNVSGYDLTRFLIGSYGYFALPIKAHLRLYALPELRLSLIIESNNLKQVFAVAKDILATKVSIAFMNLVNQRLLDNQLYNSDNKYSLVFQIDGSREIVEAEIAIVKELLAQASLHARSLTEVNEQENSLKYLAKIGNFIYKEDKAEQRIVEIAISNTACLELLLNQDLSYFPFIYNPTSNRLIYRLNSSKEQDLLLDFLSKYAKDNAQALTVAYSDNLYLRKVSKLGNDTNSGEEQIKKIKEQLKQQLDPENVFNPFVDL